MQVFVLHMQPFLVSVRHPENNFAAHFAAKILDTFCPQLYKNTHFAIRVIFIHYMSFDAVFPVFFLKPRPKLFVSFLASSVCAQLEIFHISQKKWRGKNSPLFSAGFICREVLYSGHILSLC